MNSTGTHCCHSVAQSGSRRVCSLGLSRGTCFSPSQLFVSIPEGNLLFRRALGTHFPHQNRTRLTQHLALKKGQRHRGARHCAWPSVLSVIELNSLKTSFIRNPFRSDTL